MALWTDRSGCFSPLKAAALALACTPALWIALQAAMGWLGKRPVTDAIHQTGDWAIYLLLGALLVTPLRRIANWPRLILVRRTIGVASASYALLHLSLYVADQKFDLIKVAIEIALRFYLVIGFVALAGLAAMASTSSDAMVRKLGAERWNRLHRLVYPIATLGLIHYFLQTRIDVTQPVLVSGLFLWLMGTRILHARGWPLSGSVLLALSAVTGGVTALLEATWYGLATGVNASQILAANLDFEYTIRSAWWVAAAGASLALVSLLRGPVASRATRLRPAREVESFSET